MAKYFIRNIAYIYINFLIYIYINVYLIFLLKLNNSAPMTEDGGGLHFWAFAS